MRQIVALTDTHQNDSLLRQFHQLLQSQGIEAFILHLGDNLSDARLLESWGYPVMAVPGNTCPEFRDPSVPKLRQLTVGPTQLFLIHRLEDLPVQLQAVEAAPVLIFYGHTHKSQIVLADQSRLLVNPGQMSQAGEGEHAPSFARLDCVGERFELAIVSLTGAVLQEACYLWTEKEWIQQS